MNNRIGPTVKQVWNVVMHVLLIIVGFVINRSAHLGRYSLHLLLLKSSMVSVRGHLTKLIFLANLIFRHKQKELITIRFLFFITLIWIGQTRTMGLFFAKLSHVGCPCNQCDQVGRFGNKFTYKSSPKLVETFLAILNIIDF